MKKTFSAFLALCLALGTLVFTLPSQVLAAQTEFDLTLNYTDTSVNNGIVDRADCATASTATKDSQSALKIVPKPTGTNSSKSIAVDHYSYKSRDLSITSLKTISFYCYYEGTKSLTNATLNILPGSTKCVTTTVTVSSRENIKKGEWMWINFNVSSALAGKTVADTVLSQFHFYPYGNTVTAANLSTSDVVYIAKIRLSSSVPTGGSGDIPVVFRPGRPDVTGEAPLPDSSYAAGESFTIPTAVTYSRPNHTFSHYITNVNTNTYAPGSTFTVPDKRSGSGRAGVDQTIYLLPVFKVKSSVVANTGFTEICTTDFANWFDSAQINASSPYATVTEDVDFDGRTLLKIVPNTNYSAKVQLALGVKNLEAVPWNLDYYKYATVEYYFDTDDNILSSYKPQMRLLTTGGALSSAQTISAGETVAAGKWAILTYDLSKVTLSSSVSSGNHVLKEMNFWWQPSGGDVRSFAAGSTIYMGKLTLYHEKPSTTPQLVQSYMKGDTSGKFRPHDKLTRAESAQILYNIVKAFSLTALPANPKTAFRDVKTSDWFYTPVATLETLGILPKGDAFLPSNAVARAEFAVYVQNILHLVNGKASAAGGLPFGTGETITREEAVILLNRLVFGELCWDLPDEMTEARVIRFDDIDPSIWSYIDIVAATSRRVSTFEDGKETPLALLTDTYSETVGDRFIFDAAQGDAKIAELDALTEQRIAEIRATPNTIDPASVTTGKVYYVSSSSGSSGGWGGWWGGGSGTSADSPKRVTNLGSLGLTLNAGDVVLFKRGDTFRGQLNTTAGVTYSSYGTGAKPVFIRSTETGIASTSRWTLDYENTSTGAKIWKYSSNLNDVGAINLMKSDGTHVVAYKEIPSYSNSAWWVRGKVGSTSFDYKKELDRDLEFVVLTVPPVTSNSGPVYLRCDAGNPGSVYSDIEFNMQGNCINNGTAANVTIDNICIKYFGGHGIGSSTVTGLTVTNCEIGWGGGAIQYYSDAGAVVRFGNGVEIYGGCRNYTIENCYVYQIYDAGITHQVGTETGSYVMTNVRYLNNVLEYSTYNIEYFLAQDAKSTTTERIMNGFEISGNILRKAGYGWGYQRTSNQPSNIKGWAHNNKAMDYTITDNIIDRTYNKAGSTGTYDWLIHSGTSYIGCSEPYLSGNTFIQVPGRIFIGLSNSVSYFFDTALSTTAAKLGAVNNSYYFCSQGADETSFDFIYRTVDK